MRETNTKRKGAEMKKRSRACIGLFIGLPGGIDGLVHLSDLSWSATGEAAAPPLMAPPTARESSSHATSRRFATTP